MSTAMATYFDDLFDQFATLRATVVGDAMLDRYVVGHVHRISPEAPVPVVNVETTYHRPGGAGNVAANLHRLGARTTLIGMIGDDGDGAALREVLASTGLSTDSLVAAPSAATTVKTRIVAHGQQIVRVDQETPYVSDRWLDQDIVNRFMTAQPVNLVVLSDYAKGLLTPYVCRAIIDACRERGVPVIVDPKGRDYRRYARATAITPNQAEAALAIGAADSEPLPFARLAASFIGDLGIEAVVVTRSESGVTVLLPDRPMLHLPAAAVEVADVTGAGDTFVATFSLCVAAGSTIQDAASIANVAAGVVVERVGAATVTTDELRDALRNHASRKGRRALR